jgi:nicotinate-nucleotide adenylyltransferase
MTVIATASNPDFTVSRVDIDRPGPTFTIDTLRDMKTARPEAELFFITGADAMAQILSWKNVDELWTLAHFIGVTRPGHELDGGGHDVSLLEVPAMAISSTDCRRRVESGNPVWYLVPDGVVQYIAKYGLYATNDAPFPDGAQDGVSPGLPHGGTAGALPQTTR